MVSPLGLQLARGLTRSKKYAYRVWVVAPHDKIDHESSASPFLRCDERQYNKEQAGPGIEMRDRINEISFEPRSYDGRKTRPPPSSRDATPNQASLCQFASAPGRIERLISNDVRVNLSFGAYPFRRRS